MGWEKDDLERRKDDLEGKKSTFWGKIRPIGDEKTNLEG
jgi:hypothetical protein